jgi:3-phenylpropionate/trans-cinnamate dioxygenase ferredoxin reductase component
MSVVGSIVIVGGGQAGLQTACSLRDEGFAGRILLIGDEHHPPYQRPPLSKAFIEGNLAPDVLSLRSSKFLDDKKIEMLGGDAAVAIERTSRRVRTHSDVTATYDHLVLATGTRHRPLAVPGADLDGVSYLRSIGDALALRKRLAEAEKLVVIGGGFIGLEVATVARRRGVPTTVVDIAPRLMARAVTALTSEYFHNLHARNGVAFRYHVSIDAIVGRDGKVSGVLLNTGEHLEADLVLVGIGVLPNTDLAVAAGLAAEGGIVVDDVLTTSDLDISAVGDCAVFPCRWADDQPRRLESVQNAVDQGRSVAAKLVGRPKRYASVPWFWSDQGDAKLQIAGLTADHDHVLLSGEMGDDIFSVFCFKDEALVGVESVNRPADHIAARRLLQANVRPSPDHIVDFRFDLKALEAHAKSAAVEARS